VPLPSVRVADGRRGGLRLTEPMWQSPSNYDPTMRPVLPVAHRLAPDGRSHDDTPRARVVGTRAQRRYIPAEGGVSMLDTLPVPSNDASASRWPIVTSMFRPSATFTAAMHCVQNAVPR
jgi:hypothetical protein